MVLVLLRALHRYTWLQHILSGEKLICGHVARILCPAPVNGNVGRPMKMVGVSDSAMACHRHVTSHDKFTSHSKFILHGKAQTRVVICVSYML